MAEGHREKKSMCRSSNEVKVGYVLSWSQAPHRFATPHVLKSRFFLKEKWHTCDWNNGAPGTSVADHHWTLCPCVCLGGGGLNFVRVARRGNEIL
jgi:hypothetical protein